MGSERVIPFNLVLANSSTFSLFSGWILPFWVRQTNRDFCLDWIASDAEGMRYLSFWQNIEVGGSVFEITK